MKNILFIGHTDKFYGAESVLLRVIALFAIQKGAAHVTVPLSFAHDFRNALSAEGFKVKVFRSIYRLVNPRVWLSIPVVFWNILSAIHLSIYVWRNNIDVVYSNTCLNIVGAYICLFMNRRHIWHFHEQPTNSSFKWIPPLLFPMYRYLLIRDKTTIVFVSQKQKELWELELGMQFPNFIVLYTPPRIIEKIVSKAVVSGTSFGFLGTLARPKNIILLLSIFSQLVKKYPEVGAHLKIMGSGPMEGEIKDKILDLNLSNDVTLLKHKANVANFFSEIDILVLPSVFESWGLTALEALSLHKAVIVTKNTALHEILENEQDCMFIDPAVPQELFHSMEKLLTDLDFRQIMIEHGVAKLNELQMEETFQKSLLMLIKENL